VSRRLPNAGSAPIVAAVTHEAGSDSAKPGVISIHGAREHNLKDLSVEIPRGKFVVVTGVSGSGKSTLAFDILFAEGQRRFLDSMSAYARQFVEQMARPDVDLITGLPPTVSIEQGTTRGGGKSTVATVTEAYHFIRLLFARLGTQHCPDCGISVEGQSRDAVRATLEAVAERLGPLQLFAPRVRNRKGFHADVAEWARRHGYSKLRADGVVRDADDSFRLDRFKEHDVEVLVGVLGGKDETRPSHVLVDEVLRVGDGTVFAVDRKGRQTVHSTARACPRCQRSFPQLDPKNFSYNSSQGWCLKCRGFGELFYLPDVDRGANADSVEESWFSWADQRESCPECHGARLNPVARAVRLDLAGRPASKGEAPPPTVEDLGRWSVAEARAWFDAAAPSGRTAEIARDILPEIRERLKFLCEVGLGYLQMSRSVTTLSGGEAQRIRLAAQLGSNLSGVLYVLDEPTIGLHSRDNRQLLDALGSLQARGNSLVVVEHDEDTMRRADWILDLGPGAGVRGGRIIAAGTLPELERHPESVTGRCLREKPTHPARGTRRPVQEAPRKPAGRPRAASKKPAAAVAEPAPTPAADIAWLTLEHAVLNNLKDVTVRFPLGRLVVVTGVSGSGKSTLVKECLYPAVKAVLEGAAPKTTRSEKSARAAKSAMRVTGWETLQAVHEVDQSPIGRTPRSTPATYVGFFDDIRELFSQVPEARMRGYGPGRFSFNSAQGRCPNCEGAGFVKIEMNFLPTAHVKCEVCGGGRFNPGTLDVRFNGKSVADVLRMSVAEALGFFAAQTRLRRPLEALRDTGLEYLELGQTSPTLSGGEAQRIKLVTHLLGGLKSAAVERENADLTARRPGARVPKRDLFILEEPTIGLHIEDVRRLVAVLQRLVDAGHTVVVIEHNLDLIAEADWVIDMGPEGGGAGGNVVVEGIPETVAAHPTSHTGRYLREMLRPVSGVGLKGEGLVERLKS
jgi:excinuclease ABC subunit A